jgi:hypothetical protein
MNVETTNKALAKMLQIRSEENPRGIRLSKEQIDLICAQLTTPWGTSLTEEQFQALKNWIEAASDQAILDRESGRWTKQHDRDHAEQFAHDALVEKSDGTNGTSDTQSPKT